MPPTPKKMSLPRMILFAVVAVAAFLVLKFVFSVTMAILKYGIIAAIAVFVAWLVLGKPRRGGGDG